MAQALSSSFDQWIRSLLNDLQSNDDDMTDFVEYLRGIVTSDSETDEEKLVAISELLSDLDLKVEKFFFFWNRSNRHEFSFSTIIRSIR